MIGGVIMNEDESSVFYSKYKPKISLDNPTATYRKYRERLISQKPEQKESGYPTASTKNDLLSRELDFLRSVNEKTHPAPDESSVVYNKNKPKVSLNNPTTTYRKHRVRLIPQEPEQKESSGPTKKRVYKR